MTRARDLRGWAAGLDGVVDRIALRFGCAEPQGRAGLLARLAGARGA